MLFGDFCVCEGNNPAFLFFFSLQSGPKEGETETTRTISFLKADKGMEKLFFVSE